MTHEMPFDTNQLINLAASRLLSADLRSGAIATTDVIVTGSPFKLTYEIVEAPIMTASLSLSDNSDAILPEVTFRGTSTLHGRDVSLHKLTFDARIKDFIKVTSLSLTRPDFANKGLATALTLESNNMIYDVARRLPERFMGKNIFGLIVDMSGPSNVDEPHYFTGWGSRMAERLGYRPNDTSGIIKIYRRDFGVLIK